MGAGNDWENGYAKGHETARKEFLQFDTLQAEFMQVCGQSRFTLNDIVNAEPGIAHDVLQSVSLWLALINEEINIELRPFINDVFYGNIRSNGPEDRLTKLVRIADDIGDSIYVLCGLANCLGIPLDKVYAEIHRSNMTKAVPVIEGESGGTKITHYEVQQRADGKILKPEGYKPPDIRTILLQHIQKGA